MENRICRPHQLLALAVGGVMIHSACQARPLDAVGVCPSKATISIATGPYAGKFSDLFRDVRFAQAHRKITWDQPTWLASVKGVSGKNRVFHKRDRLIVVATVCDPTNCDRNRAYIGFSPGSGAWGVSGYIDGHPLELGQPVMPGSALQVFPDELGEALICAQNLNWGE